MATKKTVKQQVPVVEVDDDAVDRLPFSRLRYNVEKKRSQIATHQVELVEMERELQLRCDHFDTTRFTESRSGVDFYNKEVIVQMICCNTCGLTRPIAG
jgi:hypothetical protein